MKERTYSVLLETIEKKLRSGELHVGDRLPGERALADKYGISRTSVREGLQILNAVGLVRSATGSGPKSGAVVASEPSEALSWAMRMHIATKTFPIADMVSTRVLLEGQAAYDAALSEDSPERTATLERARAYLTELDNPDLPNDRFHFCDARFHYEISSLSNNITLKTVIQSLHQATVSYVMEAVPLLDDWSATKLSLQEQHWAILEAVTNHEAEQAKERVTKHITWFHDLNK